MAIGFRVGNQSRGVTDLVPGPDPFKVGMSGCFWPLELGQDEHVWVFGFDILA